MRHKDSRIDRQEMKDMTSKSTRNESSKQENFLPYS